MEVSVNMTVPEFMEFMEWRREKGKYEQATERLRRAPEAIAIGLYYAVEPVEGKEGRYKIVSQEHMADTMGLVAEFMPKKKGQEKTTCAWC